MVYYRSWWAFYLCGFARRLLQRQFRQEHGLHRVAQAATDGAIARYSSVADWRALNDCLLRVDGVEIHGLKSELIPLPHGRFRDFVERLLPDAVARFLLHRLRMGSFLVARMSKA